MSREEYEEQVWLDDGGRLVMTDGEDEGEMPSADRLHTERLEDRQLENAWGLMVSVS